MERKCELAYKTTQHLYKVATPRIDDRQFKEEEMGSVGEWSNICSQIVLKCLYLARIGRPDIFWSVNKLARAITKWTRACDGRLARLMSYIHYTSGFKQHRHVGHTAQQCRIGMFNIRILILLVTWDFFKIQHRVESYAFSEVTRSCQQPISWMCKKQTSVSHCSTEAEIISLDAGFTDGWYPSS